MPDGFGHAGLWMKTNAVRSDHLSAEFPSKNLVTDLSAQFNVNGLNVHLNLQNNALWDNKFILTGVLYLYKVYETSSEILPSYEYW